MRWVARIALVVAVISALALLGLLAWSTGNATRYAQYYDILLALNVVFALSLVLWVLVLAVRLIRQIRRRQFGARLTARFALSFALIGVLPGALIYVLSVQFMSRSIESWFNVRVDSALESGLSLARVVLDQQLQELETKAQGVARQLR
ncbi:MAG TPA: histidine kinase, partial [Pusillimonas sp.]|nr:histidine kinase [Pusillimonas sp.]